MANESKPGQDGQEDRKGRQNKGDRGREMHLGDLVPDPQNRRLHNERNVGMVVQSIHEVGLARSIVIDENDVILAGNATVDAAGEAGLERVLVVETDGETLVAVRRTGLTDAQKVRLALFDNRTAELATWDLNQLVQDLDAGIDLSGIFHPDELEAAVKALEQGQAHPHGASGAGGAASGAGENDGDEALTGGGLPEGVDPDDAPDPDLDAPTRTALGELWSLGDHRLLVGDATDPKTLFALFADPHGQIPKRAAALFLDPPFINIAMGTQSNPRYKQRDGLANDDMTPAEFQRFLRGLFAAALPYVTGDWYVKMGCEEWAGMDTLIREAGLHWSATVVWVKDQFVIGRSKYHRRYEPIWYGWPAKGKSSFVAGRDLDDVWEIPRHKKSAEHPTMTPVALIEKAILCSTNRGEIVYDGCAGSGPTLVAAQKTGRTAYCAEISPVFADVILARWEAISGRRALLLSSVVQAPQPKPG